MMTKQLDADQRHLQAIKALPEYVEVLNYRLGSMNEPTVYLEINAFRRFFQGASVVRCEGWLTCTVDGLRFLALEGTQYTPPRIPPSEVLHLPPVAEAACEVTPWS